MHLAKVVGLALACRELTDWEVLGSRNNTFLEETIVAWLQGLYRCHKCHCGSCLLPGAVFQKVVFLFLLLGWCFVSESPYLSLCCPDQHAK